MGMHHPDNLVLRAIAHAMNHDEMHRILSEHLAKFGTWSFAQLAERVERDRRTHDCLDCSEGVAPDGTEYVIEINAYWDDKHEGNVRVCGDISATPQRPLWGFIPIYMPDATDSFIMAPDGRFIGEQ